MMADVEIEVLVVPACPHAAGAIALARRVLNDLELAATPIEVTEVETLAEADRRGFVGSPTILVDGVDPFAVPGQQPALACRLYSVGPGVSPLPDEDALRRALVTASADPTI